MSNIGLSTLMITHIHFNRAKMSKEVFTSLPSTKSLQHVLNQWDELESQVTGRISVRLMEKATNMWECQAAEMSSCTALVKSLPVSFSPCVEGSQIPQTHKRSAFTTISILNRKTRAKWKQKPQGKKKKAQQESGYAFLFTVGAIR